MADQETRSPATGNTSKVKEGILLAKVVGFLDPSFMCGLEVTLLDESGNTIGDINQTYPVKYASPFYGATAFENMGLNKTDSNDSQKSYGMWFPTPEIGTTILVAFVNGNSADGYFIACVPGRFMNHMVPAIAGSTAVELTAADKKKYDTTSPLPVTEINRKTNNDDKALEIEKIKKPVHPIADAFLRQGVLEDDVRGVTTSTSRRNVPNTVFGISTPGPADRRAGAKHQFIGKQQSKSEKPVPVSRLGGTTLVFDDGDDQYLRKGPAATTAYKYLDVLDKNIKEKGDVTIPYNEYFRIRTRTGHQLLMHNSEDLIYIGNAAGTSWIEMTSNGKIDIYAEDSVSIHTRADFNFRADRDINLEAGRNLNIRTGGLWHADIGKKIDFLVEGSTNITVGANFELLVGSSTKISTTNTMHINSGASNNFTAAGDTNIASGGDHTESAAGQIHMNGPAATPAESAAPVKPLPLHTNPNRSSSSTWGDKKRYKAGTIQSIMKRIPMHEPWEFHENNAPKSFIPKNTDRET
jgi:hypothetical protein